MSTLPFIAAEEIDEKIGLFLTTTKKKDLKLWEAKKKKAQAVKPTGWARWKIFILNTVKWLRNQTLAVGYSILITYYV